MAHSTCSMATSWAVLKGVVLGEICAAASWSTPCTFAWFYRVDAASDLVSSAVLLSVAGQTGEEESSVPCDAFGTGNPR